MKAKWKFGFKSQNLQVLLSGRRKDRFGCLASPWLFAAGGGSEGGMEREGPGSFARLVHAPGILHGLGLGLILALPCKVAEGDEQFRGFSELIPGDRRALE